MRWLFFILIGALTLSDILNWEMSMGPGLSVKNAILYVIALGLFFRLALSGEFRLRLPIMHVCFIIWITYSLLSWIACSLVIHYAGYNVIQSAIALKAELIDPALFFFTVFYGAQKEVDFRALWKALLIAVGIANVVTLTDVFGLTNFGVRVGTTGAEADRVFGVFGHANETAALIVYLLPGMVAAAKAARGPSRLVWYCAAAASLAVFILTISRGGYVALVIGYAWAIFICRRYLPLSRVAAWVLTGVTVSLIVVAVISVAVPHVGEVVTGRFLGQSTAIDMSEVSSGRTNIWKNTFEHMMAQPVTLVTGFGWNVYNTRFIFVTHNYYLDQWFNLGLIGLGALLVILYQAVVTAKRAADAADPETRSYMIAFIFGILALAVSIFFTNLTRPWPYVWMYMGLTLRAAANVLAEAERKEAPKSLRASPSHVIAHSHAQAVRNSR